MLLRKVLEKNAISWFFAAYQCRRLWHMAHKCYKMCHFIATEAAPKSQMMNLEILK